MKPYTFSGCPPLSGWPGKARWFNSFEESTTEETNGIMKRKAKEVLKSKYTERKDQRGLQKKASTDLISILIRSNWPIYGLK